MSAPDPSTNHPEEAETIEVRLATELDAMMLAKFRYEFRSSVHDVIEGDASFVERCAAWMQDRLRRDSHWKCWIAEYGQTAVGNVWAQLIEKIPNPIAEAEQFVYVTNLYVRPEYRNKEAGSRLLSAVMDWSRNQDAYTVILWPTERSKPFYSRHGFSMTDEIMQSPVDAKRT